MKKLQGKGTGREERWHSVSARKSKYVRRCKHPRSRRRAGVKCVEEPGRPGNTRSTELEGETKRVQRMTADEVRTGGRRQDQGISRSC